MEELIEKRIKKYRTISIVGIIIFLVIILFQIWYAMDGNYSCSSSSYTSISVQEINAFNGQFDSYKGKKLGLNVKALLSKLSANATAWMEVKDRIPEIKYEDKESLDFVYFQCEESDLTKRSYELKKYKDWINDKIEKIIDKATYNIELGYDESTKLINLVKITRENDV